MPKTPSNPTVAIPDFDFENHGSLALLRPLTETGRAWINENVTREGFQPWWPTVIIEARYLRTILEGIVDSGLVIL